MNKIKRAFILGQVLIVLIVSLFYIIYNYYELSILYLSIFSIVSILLWILFYQIVTGKFKKKEEPQKLPGIHAVKNELKGYSKNKLIGICISLQADLLRLQKGKLKKA